MIKSIPTTVKSVLSTASAKVDFLDALVLLEHVSAINRAKLMAEPDAHIHTAISNKYLKLTAQRARGVPLAYILGAKEFYGLEFKVTKDVLIPRPETESLVELAIKVAPKNGALLDVGTGSGAIAIAVANARTDLKITASDISPAALEVAKHNAKAHLVKINCTKSNLFAAWQGPTLPRKFDVVCANLPYVRDKAALLPEGMQEPALALRGGNDGLDIYKRFFAEVGDYLSPNGYVIIEAEPAQHKKLKIIAAGAGFKLTKTTHYALLFKSITA